MSLKRFGVSLEENVLDSLDSYVAKSGFANRSQAIKFLVEKNIAEEKWQCNHIVSGTIQLMYDHSQGELASKIENVEKLKQELILSASNYYISKSVCLHVVVVKGIAKDLTALSDELLAIKGLLHGKLLMSRAD